MNNFYRKLSQQRKESILEDRPYTINVSCLPLMCIYSVCACCLCCNRSGFSDYQVPLHLEVDCNGLHNLLFPVFMAYSYCHLPVHLLVFFYSRPALSSFCTLSLHCSLHTVHSTVPSIVPCTLFLHCSLHGSLHTFPPLFTVLSTVLTLFPAHFSSTVPCTLFLHCSLHHIL